MNKRIDFKKDVYIGATTVLVGLIAVFGLVPYGVELYEVDSSTLLLIRPDFWPLVVGWMMIAGGTLFAIISLRSRPEITADVADKTDFYEGVSHRKLAVCVGVVLIFLTAGKTTGMVLPAIALFAISSVGFSGGKTWMKIVGSILTPLLLVFFFERVADIPIPLGILEGMF